MKVIAGIVLVFLLGTMFVSLFHMSMGMDISGSMSDCPFSAHEEVLCPMNLADHITAWKTMFLAVAPVTIILLTGAVALLAAFSPVILGLRREVVTILYRQFRRKRYRYSYRPLQEMFSSGVLHPKVF
jgi:hypothetical protein